MCADPTTDTPLIYCIGEVLWDCFPDCKALGGAVLNVAYMVQALGARAIMASRVGDDENGREIVERMKSSGLDARFIQVDDEHATGRVAVAVSESGEPTFTIVEDAAYDYMAWDDSAEDVIRSCDAVCFGTLAQRNRVSRETILKTLDVADHARKFYDINLRSEFFTRQIIAESLSRCHVAKLNSDELKRIQEMFPEAWNDGVTTFLDHFDLECLAVTCGGDGCLLYRRGEEAEAPGIEVPVEDTVGSGDAFTASLVLSYLKGESLQRIGEEANLLGAYVATQRGATPAVAGYREKMREHLRPTQ